jgi:LEA14-like dessication related protein
MRLLGLMFMFVVATGCRSAGGPQLRVLGVHDDAPTAHEVVYVQVTNPANQPMKLTKLEYTFAADGATVSTGEVPLARDIPAGAAVVVEVPLDSTSDKPMTLQGKLTAESDQVVRTFDVEAQIAPH